MVLQLQAATFVRGRGRVGPRRADKIRSLSGVKLRAARAGAGHAGYFERRPWHIIFL
jgi:hypothetical protein